MVKKDLSSGPETKRQHHVIRLLRQCLSILIIAYLIYYTGILNSFLTSEELKNYSLIICSACLYMNIVKVVMKYDKRCAMPLEAGGARHGRGVPQNTVNFLMLSFIMVAGIGAYFIYSARYQDASYMYDGIKNDFESLLFALSCVLFPIYTLLTLMSGLIW